MGNYKKQKTKNYKKNDQMKTQVLAFATLLSSTAHSLNLEHYSDVYEEEKEWENDARKYNVRRDSPLTQDDTSFFPPVDRSFYELDLDPFNSSTTCQTIETPIGNPWYWCKDITPWCKEFVEERRDGPDDQNYHLSWRMECDRETVATYTQHQMGDLYSAIFSIGGMDSQYWYSAEYEGNDDIWIYRASDPQTVVTSGVEKGVLELEWFVTGSTED